MSPSWILENAVTMQMVRLSIKHDMIFFFRGMLMLENVVP